MEQEQPFVIPAWLRRNMERRTEADAEQAGYDAGTNGPNTVNCHFSYFAAPDLTRAWERGHARGKSDIAKWEAEADLADGDGL